MVNSISNTPNSPDLGPRISAGSKAPSSAKPTTKTEFSGAEIKRNTGDTSAADTRVSAPKADQNASALASQALSPPFTSLALYKDPESGLQVAVIRDRMTGETEVIPSERMQRLAAMYKEQEDMAALSSGSGYTQVDV